MFEGEDLEALQRTLGEAGVERHEPFSIDGAELSVTLHPADQEALAETLRLLSERRLGVVVCGGGSRCGFGNPPRGAKLLLATGALQGVDVIDAEEGVAHARAGTPLAALREAARGSGWEVPLDPPGAQTTLGGSLAAAAFGPRRLGFGRPRDLVLGLEVVLGDGLRTKCGGRVVKNVTGYDLMKLHIGALGTLGVIDGAWLRLRPAPECTEIYATCFAPGEPALEGGLTAARLASARVVALLSSAWVQGMGSALFGPDRDAVPSSPGGYGLVVELAGDEETVARDRRRLAERAVLLPAEPSLLEAVRALQGAEAGQDGLRFCLTARPSRLGATLEELEQGGASLLVYPGCGVVYAGFGAAGLGCEWAEAALQATWDCVRTAARRGGGSFVLEAGPTHVKRGRDVFEPTCANLALLRTLKQRFDPAGILNPGRFVGGL